MSGVFELVCIILAYIAIMIIFGALRSIKDDLCCQSATLDLIDARIKLFDVKKEYREVSEITEAYEQGKKDAHIWTPTAESPPPVGMQVLTTARSGEEVTAFLTRDENGVYLWNGNGTPYFFEYMVAWQKLPEPYKEECTGDSCPISYKD